MKIKYILLALLFSGALQAQLPQAFSFQGMAMDSNGDLVVDAVVGIEVSILEKSASGSSVYTELHTVNTSDLGHFNLEIGRGTPSGNAGFSDIDWRSEAHFAQISMDVAGGTNFSLVGVVTLVSVPYAFQALVSGAGLEGPQGPQGPQGNAGPQGAPGPKGAPGVDNGGAAVQGPIGPVGPVGPQGLAGPAGPAGTSIGVKGPQGPAGFAGADHPDAGSGNGPKGPDGSDGAPGPIGPQGPTGKVGEVGEQGINGPDGPQGLPGLGGGIPGPKGDRGPEGPSDGPAGAPGNPGFNGAQGPQGAQGPPGARGANGPSGPAGKLGPLGIANSPMLSTPPAGNNGLGYYLDDGSNRADGLPGFRFWNANLNAWVD